MYFVMTEKKSFPRTWQANIFCGYFCLIASMHIEPLMVKLVMQWYQSGLMGK